MGNQDEDAQMAEADKLLEERANRAKEILNKRYKSLRQDQVGTAMLTKCWQRRGACWFGDIFRNSNIETLVSPLVAVLL